MPSDNLVELPPGYLERVIACNRALGIEWQHVLDRGLPWMIDPGLEAQVVAAHTPKGKPIHAHPQAHEAWLAMKALAARDEVELILLSAYRSLESQAHIIERKLKLQQPLERIFAASAPPGFSEHHTGRALDIGTPGCEPQEEPFADTPAYAWLEANASRFDFRLSYPRGNAQGFIYEPWHWYYTG